MKLGGSAVGIRVAVQLTGAAFGFATVDTAADTSDDGRWHLGYGKGVGCATACVYSRGLVVVEEEEVGGEGRGHAQLDGEPAQGGGERVGLPVTKGLGLTTGCQARRGTCTAGWSLVPVGVLPGRKAACGNSKPWDD